MELHLLRPEWLAMLLVPVVLLALTLIKSKNAERLSQAIDEPLRKILIKGEQAPLSRIQWRPLLITTLLAIALAGPAVDKAPSPSGKGDLATILILDLSPSMWAQDAAPNRIEQAKRKLSDLLETLDTDLMSLIVYSGEAYTVVPPTDDHNTIEAMLPVLDPAIMPNFGSSVEMAIALATEQAERHQGTSQVIIITDGLHPDSVKAVNELNTQLSTAVLLIGTVSGAPIPNANGYIMQNGQQVIAKATPVDLDDLSTTLAIRASRTNDDVLDIASSLQVAQISGDTANNDTFDRYVDRGPLLALLAFLLLLPSLRPTAIATILLVTVTLPISTPALADNFMQSDDRRTFERYQQQPTETTAFELTDPRWRAYALSQQQQRQAALETYAAIENPSQEDLLNMGNNLTHEAAYPQAEAMYRRVLALDPNNQSAQLGLDIIDALRAQNQQEDQQGNQPNEQQQSEQNNEQQENEDQNTDQQQESQSNSEQSQNDADQQNEEQMPQQTPPQESGQPPPQISDNERISEEEAKQELEQLLRSLPDDPGGLLRRKFRYEYEKNYRNRTLNRTEGERW